jgi:transposase
MSDLFGAAGQQLLDELDHPAYNARVVSLRRLIDALSFEIDIVARWVAAQLAGHLGYRAVQAIDGFGPILATVLVVEIGDVHRFPGPEQLCSWAGMTPKHREDTERAFDGPLTRYDLFVARPIRSIHLLDSYMTPPRRAG